ncbi:MAG: DUF3459 domain-containing protein, partial [Cyanobacteria bacterium P01_H01_bin.119]
QDLFKVHRELIRLRHLHPALQTGKYQGLAASGQLLVFARILPEQTIAVAINTGDAPAQINVTWPLGLSSPPAKQLYGSGTASMEGDRLDLQLAARSALILGT